MLLKGHPRNEVSKGILPAEGGALFFPPTEGASRREEGYDSILLDGIRVSYPDGKSAAVR